MKSIFFLFTLLLVPAIGGAQINKGAFDDYLYFVNQNKPNYEGVEGTPYLSDDFIPARINNNKKLVYVKFNVFANNIEFKKPDGAVVLLSLEQDYKFELQDESKTEYEIHTYRNEKDQKSRVFFRKVYTGQNFTLFIKENVKFTPKKIATSGFEQNQPAKFTKSKSTYYVARPSEDVQELLAVPKSKKEVSTFFKESAKTVQQFIKKQSLKLDNTEDLVELFDFYYSKN